ncbi:hypothetical protein BJ165DRAFT_1337959 [Panaeolus papilionaceus]|nr:hypothetical protein BJ165DRAFT_1337959 [Panaeolus papilionaceus]
MIILYDIPSKLEGRAWSPNPWKVRYALNYKGLDHKTEWVEYCDIEAHCKALSIPADPYEKKPDGSAKYTLPAIWDTTTGAKVSDSRSIIEYLETTYPDKPSLFPNNTKGLQIAFEKAYKPQLDGLWLNILPLMPKVLNPASEKYFYRTRSEMFGAPLETLLPTGAAFEEGWAKLKAGLDVIDGWYQTTDVDGVFLMGDKLGWSDIMLISYLKWVTLIWGKEEAKWKDIARWNGGRWAKLVDALEKYTELK